MDHIPFNRPFLSGLELEYISQAHTTGALSGNGPFSKICETLIEEEVGCAAALLTHSCTAALEMTALILDLQPSDEVIMPSYTFVSTANAFALRGATPVFVDIRADTLNIDETLIEAAITDRTKAICIVHYAGVACEMDSIMAVAKAHGLPVIEDAAQAIASSYKGQALGSFGRFGALSFHETKNVTCGEGGALLLNEQQDRTLAEILREKGTDRSKFLRGHVDKYSWQTIGSSFLLGELSAAFLRAQLEILHDQTARRLEVWNAYDKRLRRPELADYIRCPVVPQHCVHNAHMYYVLAISAYERTYLLDAFRQAGIGAVFHYVPLHSAVAGRTFSRANDDMTVTNDLSERLIRLPMWVGLDDDQIHFITEVIVKASRRSR